jgi:hypothetical protein
MRILIKGRTIQVDCKPNQVPHYVRLYNKLDDKALDKIAYGSDDKEEEVLDMNTEDEATLRDAIKAYKKEIVRWQDAYDSLANEYYEAERDFEQKIEMLHDIVDTSTDYLHSGTFSDRLELVHTLKRWDDHLDSIEDRIAYDVGDTG